MGLRICLVWDSYTFHWRAEKRAVPPGRQNPGRLRPILDPLPRPQIATRQPLLPLDQRAVCILWCHIDIDLDIGLLLFANATNDAMRLAL